MDPDLYHNEIMRQLNDKTYYHAIDGSLRHNNVININAIIETLRIDGFITERQFDYLRASDLDRDRSFYILPKIHKPQIEWPHPRMPAGRPIMADVGTESSRVSEYIDSWLQPLASQHTSFIKDTYDFLNHIRDKQVSNDCYLVTGDVTSLYTNMYTDTAITKLKDIMHRQPDRTRPDGQLIELLHIICDNNDFKYHDKYYQQHRGFAMGKRFSPSMANIYMIDLDSQAINHNPTILQLYKRFLDDIFFIWNDNLTSLENFEKFLNTLEPGIQIKLKWHQNQIDFLDTTIFKVKDDFTKSTLCSKPFFKATDSHQLLHTKSFHPRHTALGVLKSQLIRFKRLSSTREDYNEACNILFKSLATRGYSNRKLTKTKFEIWHRDEMKTLEEKKIKESKPIFAVVNDYNRFGVELSRKWLEILKRSKIGDKYRCISAYRNSKNINQRILAGKREKEKKIEGNLRWKK